MPGELAVISAYLSRPTFSVVVPVFNEERTIDELLGKLFTLGHSEDIVVVDDGSSDGTAECLRKYGACAGIRVITHNMNRGKGAAIRTGLAVVRGDFVIVQDADLEYSPEDYPALLVPLRAGEADLVYGSRRLDRTWQWSEWVNPYYHAVSLLNFAVWLIYGVRLTDEATCYKVARTTTLRSMQLQCERFEYCPEVTAKACRMKLRIKEVPISYTRRTAADGKKIRLRDWFEAVQTLWRWRNWNPAIEERPSSDATRPQELSRHDVTPLPVRGATLQ